MSTQHHRHVNSQQNLRKFKVMPFVWESQNYLLKLKQDCAFLINSSFSKFFNFSTKSDPFLVFPSTKQLGGVPGSRVKRQTSQKVLIPLANTHMKLIRQSEVYLMEEAVTESIIRQANQTFGQVSQEQY